MAVDTRNKRGSSACQGLIGLEILPDPDGNIDQADRQQTAWSYPGILAAGEISYSDVGTKFLYRQAEIPGLWFELEVDARATVGTVYARLYDITDDVLVANSVITITNGTFDLSRSNGSLTLTEGNKYKTQVGKQGADVGEIQGSTVLGFS